MNFYYTLIMPNQPAEDTVTASLTMPRALLDEVKAKAKRQMTTVSDVIRKALMNYLSPAERARVQALIDEAAQRSHGGSIRYPPHRPDHFSVNEKPEPRQSDRAASNMLRKATKPSHES